MMNWRYKISPNALGFYVSVMTELNLEVSTVSISY